LVSQVELKIVCEKTTKVNQDIMGRLVIPLHYARGREKVTVMEKKLMYHYRQQPLPSKKPKYIPYTIA